MTSQNLLPTTEKANLVSLHVHTEKWMFGTMVVHVHWAGGRVMSELFTFDCLAGVLGLPESVVEGRYKRTGLRKLAVRTTNEFGREIRAFPMAIRDQVLDILQHAGSRVQGTTVANGRTAYVYSPKARHDVYAGLDVTFWKGGMYLTVAALASCFGVTAQTIRARMKAAGLWSQFVPLTRSTPHSGRPAAGLPYALAGDVWLAMRDANGGHSDLRELLRRAHESGAAADAQREMEAVMNIPADPDPLAADPTRNDPVPELAGLTQEIERALAG